jgi:hypothetical protein
LLLPPGAPVKMSDMSAHFFHLDASVQATANLQVRSEIFPSATGSSELAIRIDAPPAGGHVYFFGAPGRVGDVAWSGDMYFVLPVYQDSGHGIELKFLFYENTNFVAPEGAPHARLAMGIFPDLLTTVTFPLHKLDLSTLFLPRTPGRGKNTSTGTPVQPEKVDCWVLEIPQSSHSQTIWIGVPRLADAEPAYDVPHRVEVDKLGQWARKEWPGKTRDEAELVEYLRELAQSTLSTMQGPLSAFGGWTEKQLEASGFFRTQHDGARWWLVDPAGHPFWSTGPDCVRPEAGAYTRDIESLFEWLPSREESTFAPAWHGADRPEFSFTVANLIRAFGDDWQMQWEKMTGNLLRRWGFNTVANWSVDLLGQRVQMPYVRTMKGFPSTTEKVFRDFPDVFSPEYTAGARQWARQLVETRDDPYLIGYFLGNEPNWGFGDYNIAEFLLAHAAPLHSKTRLIEFLRERYADNIHALSGAWHKAFASFDDFLQPLEHAAALSDAAAHDLQEFTKVLVREFLRVPSLACRAVDANHLNLGIRWAWVASEAFYEGAEFLDVFSINCYALQPSPEEIRRHSQKTGKPIMIGEFHAGALDVGLPSTGLRGMANQEERGHFYSWYIEHGAAIPELVGAHYFQWMDQPALGRFDGEACNIGLIDTCFKPHTAMLESARRTHERLYEVAAGAIPPTERKPVEVPAEGFGDAAPSRPELPKELKSCF